MVGKVAIEFISRIHYQRSRGSINLVYIPIPKTIFKQYEHVFKEWKKCKVIVIVDSS